MAKEFRISAAVTLPDDMSKEAEVIAALKPVMAGLIDGLTKAAGAEAVTADCSVVTPKPRGERVLIVVADPEEFEGERAPAAIVPDQGDLESVAVVHSDAPGAPEVPFH